jgi:hypothetical protein
MRSFVELIEAPNLGHFGIAESVEIRRPNGRAALALMKLWETLRRRLDGVNLVGVGRRDV